MHDSARLLEPIWYELWMLQETDNLLRRLDAESERESERVEFNAALESFLLHFRCLSEFALGSSYPSDIRLEQFDGIDCCLDAGSSDKRLKGADSLDACRTRANKRLAHLTQDRVKAAPDWNTEEMRRMVNAVLVRFIQVLPQQYFPKNHSREDFTDLLSFQ